MSFAVSPGISVREIDLTTTVPSVATTAGAFGGLFQWGPVDQVVLVTSEKQLATLYGTPKNNYNIETWFSAANFLGYSNQLYVVRGANTTTTNTTIATYSAFAGSGSAAVDSVKNVDDYESKTFTGSSSLYYIAKYPGQIGNSLKISVCDTAAQFQSNIGLVTVESAAFANAATKLTVTVGANSATITLTGANTQANNVTTANNVYNLFNIGDNIDVGNTSIGKQALRITGKSGITQSGSNNQNASFVLNLADVYKLSVDFDTAVNANTVTRSWQYANIVDVAPGQSAYVAASGNTSANDLLHVVVVDQDGKFSGTPGTVLEVYQNLSRATDAKGNDGSSIYYKTVLNDQSNYVWWANDRPGAVSNAAISVVSGSNTSPLLLSFTGGQDGASETSADSFSNVVRAYDKLAATETAEFSLVIAGRASGANDVQLGNYLIDNIAESRRDCVVFVSPARADVVNAVGSEAQNVVDFRNLLRSTSYAVLDSGYKYQYDKYNDLFHYVPLNGDIAGLCAFTDLNRDPWFSPAGFSRGNIRNVVKLPFNPNQAERDLLYKNGVNPVVTFPGQGTILFGDKTLLKQTSAFDRINVRRLFIVLEKAISTAAQSSLFEFNDEFTRAQFRSLVEPFLRDVQGRRGITNFRVVCDETNNTSQVIDSNSFVGDIYVRPNRSINFIRLNFVAVRSGVEFTEISG